MKKVLSVLVVALLASTAGAAQLDLALQGAGPYTVGTPIYVDVIISNLQAGDSLTGVGFVNEPVAELTQTQVTSAQPNWIGVAPGDAQNGVFGTNTFSASAFDPNADAIAGPDAGPIVVGTQEVIASAAGTFEITISNDFPIGIGNGSGQMTFAPNFATYSNYYTIGVGSPGIPDAGFGEAPRNALVLEVVPEPASLALLALGGFALIRRR